MTSHAVRAIALGALLAAGGHTAAQQKRVHEISRCTELKDSGTRYILTQDVSSAGTCFAIAADDVTLDLGGHTVTYATGESPNAVFGVLAADCWFKPIEGNPCGGTHRRAEIEHGSIVQGSGAAPASHAIRFGQANNLTGVRVHDLTIEVQAEDSIAIYSEYLPGGSDVYGNTIHNNVRVISNRMQFRGASIKLDEERNATLPDRIHDNVIVGGAQIGIRSDNPAGTVIANNDIAQDAVYTNGFCIDAAGNNMQVTGNHCHPLHGRGIHANHSGVLIADNVVETVDSNQNAEYKGCEINGTYGIQIEDDDFAPQDMRVVRNHVRVHARECPAEAMRATDLKGTHVEIENNEFVAVQDTVAGAVSQQPARAISFGDVDGTHMRITGNAMQADSAILHVDWDAAGNLTLDRNTFRPGASAKSVLLADIVSGARPTQRVYFSDNVMNGISPASGQFGAESRDSWYAIAQQIDIDVHAAAPASLRGSLQAAGGTRMEAVRNGSQLIFTVPQTRYQHGTAPASMSPYRITVESNCDTVAANYARASEIPRQVTPDCKAAR